MSAQTPQELNEEIIAEIDPEWIEAAYEWHGGQVSMLYAFASARGMRPGRYPPMHPAEDRLMTDPEWCAHLWDCLACEIARDIGNIAEAAEDERLVALCEFAESAAGRLAAAFGLAEV